VRRSAREENRPSICLTARKEKKKGDRDLRHLGLEKRKQRKRKQVIARKKNNIYTFFEGGEKDRLPSPRTRGKRTSAQGAGKRGNKGKKNMLPLLAAKGRRRSSKTIWRRPRGKKTGGAVLFDTLKERRAGSNGGKKNPAERRKKEGGNE